MATQTMTLQEFLATVVPLLLAHVMDQADKDLDIGKVSAYWVGAVLRIDIKTNGN